MRVGQGGHSRLVNAGPETIRKEGGSISSSRRVDSKIGYEGNVDSSGKEGPTLSLKPVDRGRGRNVSVEETGPRSRRNRSVEPGREKRKRDTRFVNAGTQTDDSSSESGSEASGIAMSQVAPKEPDFGLNPNGC